MKMYIAGLVVMICCVGCFGPTYVKITDRYPEYVLPARSEISKISEKELESLSPETKKKIIDSVMNLKSECTQLRTILESYNEYAKNKNKNQ